MVYIKKILKVFSVPFLGFLFVASVLYAATTIGTNIDTGGLLTVAPGYSLDTSSAGVLNIGTTTANAITIGRATVTTSILGSASTTLLSAATAFWVGGNATTTSAGAISTQSTLGVTATSTLATTTVNRFLSVGSTTPQHGTADVLIDGTATTTLQLSTSGALTVGTCIQMKSVAGANTRIYVPVGGVTLIVEPGLCK